MLRKHLELFYRIVVILDALVLVGAFALAYRLGPYLPVLFPGLPSVDLYNWREYAWLLLVAAPTWIFLLHLERLYGPIRARNPRALAGGVLKSGLIATALLTLVLYALKIHYSRVLIALFGLLAGGLLLVEKWALRGLLGWLHRLGYNQRRVLIIGSQARAEDVLTRIRSEDRVSFAVVGCLDPDPTRTATTVAGVPVLGTLGDHREVICRGVDEVIVAIPPRLLPDLPSLIAFCAEVGVKVHLLPEFPVSQRDPRPPHVQVEVEDFLGVPVMSFSMTPAKVGQLFCKQCLDVLVSGTLLLLLSPLFLLIALAIKLTSPGPVFYRWRVSGLNGREFTSYKFRTMVVNADELKPALLAQNERTGPVFKITRDPRVTLIGRILRKYSLDELPQLWSVLKGDMSLVGPRPPLQTESRHFEYWQRRKLSVKPGVTGLWQVNGRSSIKDFNEWVRMDLEYIDNWSLWLDLKILLKTIPAVIRGTGV